MNENTPALAKSQPVDAVVAPESVAKAAIIPEGWPQDTWMRIQKDLKDPSRARGLVFEDEKQRNAMAIRKGLTKPGRISYDVLRRISMSVYVARICINSLKSKVTKTKWVIQPIDQTKRKKTKNTDERIKQVEEFFRHPNQNNETFRTLLDKMTEDLLVLDAVSLEKTRYEDGSLAELHFVDSATIRPVYDNHGNQDIEIPLGTVKGEQILPTSYVQVMNNSQYGGPESGDIVAAWPKKDFIHFHMHPQGALESFGYGLSPLEGVLSVVSNLLNSDNFNSTYFEEGAFPPVILNIVGQMNQRDMDAFKEYFYQELSGNFHRPALLASQQKSEVINLKEFTNRDMQFMEYTTWMAKMLCAAYEMSPQDIGITDDINKATAEVQKDISQAKGYGSILDLFRQIFNQEIIWKDFGYDDLEFDWVAADSTEPDIASQIQDRGLRNGSVTLNEVRLQNGESPYGEWADKPMILMAEGYRPLMAENNETEEEGNAKIIGGEKPYRDQDTEDVKDKDIKKMRKSVLTQSGYKCWADDRGVGQPFIFADVKTGNGCVIKPPAAVNLQSQNLEVQLTNQLAGLGLNVKPVNKQTYVELRDSLATLPDVQLEFDKYCTMAPEYDSEKWRSKFGGSRKFAYYLVSDYIDGYTLNNPLLIADMKRDPASYAQAAQDLAKLWQIERDMVLGDRRADQYIISSDKRGWGFDYQFMGDYDRWEKTSTALPNVLAQIPELKAIFDATVQAKAFSLKSMLKSLLNKMSRKPV